MNKLILMIAIAIAMVLWSCERYNDNDDTKDNSVIMNLKVGNEWDHLIIRENINKGFDTTEVTYEIKETQELNSEMFFLYGRKGSNSKNHAINKSDGFFIYDTSKKIFIMIAKYPCKIGEFYINAGGDTMNVISTQSQIVVSGKSYTAIHYQSKNLFGIDASYSDLYMSPGIGLIKVEHYRINSNNEKVVSLIEELKEFRPGKD